VNNGLLKVKVFVGIVLLTGTTLLMRTETAWAICNPGRGVYCNNANEDWCDHSAFTGGYSGQWNVSVTTAQATISAYTPYVDFAHGGSVSAWPMIVQTACGGGFAQAGQGEIFHAHLDSFYEYANCNTVYAPVEYDTTNAAHLYVVNHAVNSGAIALYIDNVEVFATTTDWLSDEGQYFGETHAADDQMYGAVTVPGQFTGMTECINNGHYVCFNPVTNNDWVGYNDPSGWYFYNNASNELNIGDNYCVS